jgi:hypothetical protein
MLTLKNGQAGIVCDRREFLRQGAGLVAAGFVLPAWLYGNRNAAHAMDSALSAADRDRAGTAKSCILVYLLGGPPHLDMFDLKPNAPAEIRGPFRPIATELPGLFICEHLPRLHG